MTSTFTLFHVSRKDYLCGEILKIDKSGTDSVIHAKFELAGQNWGRGEEHSESLTDDYHVTLHQVLLRYDSVLSFCEKLDLWLESPFDMSEELSGIAFQSFILSFNTVKESAIVDVYKPMATVQYCGGRLDFVCGFLVDQSCIACFNDELKACLREVEGG